MPTKNEYARAIAEWHIDCVATGCPYDCGYCVGNKFTRVNQILESWETRAIRDVGVDLQTLKLNHAIGKYNDE
jgi:hypothetical protein